MASCQTTSLSRDCLLHIRPRAEKQTVDLSKICCGTVVLGHCCCRGTEIHDSMPPAAWHKHCLSRRLQNRNFLHFFIFSSQIHFECPTTTPDFVPQYVKLEDSISLSWEGHHIFLLLADISNQDDDATMAQPTENCLTPCHKAETWARVCGARPG